MNSTEMGGDSDPRQTMEAEKQFVEALSKSETRKVRIWRRNVLIVLGVTGALLTTVTYLFLLRQDTDGFDTSVCTEKDKAFVSPDLVPLYSNPLILAWIHSSKDLHPSFATLPKSIFAVLWLVPTVSRRYLPAKPLKQTPNGPL